eukprot:3673062-Rhodomonas_salina.1
MDSVWQKSVIEGRTTLTLGATRNRRKLARPGPGPGIKFPVPALWGESRYQSPLTSISDMATGHSVV